MSDETQRDRIATPRDDWSVPLPERLPKPTYWPAVAALGITFIFFGVVTSWAFSIAGGALLAFSIAKWVGELLDAD